MNNIEIIITMTSIFLIAIIYDIIKNKGKIYFNILKTKINIQNKDNWSNDTIEIQENTKYIELSFLLQLYNHKKTNNCLYNINIYKKNKLKKILIENSYINLLDTVKSISGSNTYEKLKYINFLPYEIKEYMVKIKFTKEEFLNIKKYPIYIIYKTGKQTKKIKLNKYLRKKKLK